MSLLLLLQMLTVDVVDVVVVAVTAHVSTAFPGCSADDELMTNTNTLRQGVPRGCIYTRPTSTSTSLYIGYYY